MDAEVPKGRGLGEKLVIEGVRNIVAVSSGKGGVGKSTVAVNLAVSLALDGARVGLMDADVYGPNVPIMLGASDARPEVDGNKLIPIEAFGVKFMSMALLQPGDKPMIVRGPILHGLVKQFLSDVKWGELDYLIVDMPPGTGDVQLSLAQLVPVQGAVLVTTPQNVAVADVRRALRMFETVAIPVLGIVENMSYFIAPDTGTRYNIFGEGGGQRLANDVSRAVSRRSSARNRGARRRRQGRSRCCQPARFTAGTGVPKSYGGSGAPGVDRGDETGTCRFRQRAIR